MSLEALFETEPYSRSNAMEYVSQLIKLHKKAEDRLAELGVKYEIDIDLGTERVDFKSLVLVDQEEDSWYSRTYKAGEWQPSQGSC